MTIREITRSFSLTVVAALFTTAGACRDFAAEPDPIPTTGSPDAGIEAAADAGASLPYGQCPGLYSGLCATVEMPLDWDNPNGKKVGVLIDKIATTPRPTKQIWLLQGGPGGPAADMVPVGRDLAQRVPDLEVLTIEHRGVGASNRLGCPKTEATPAPTNLQCAEEAKPLYGDDLRYYTTTNAAKDLARAIELTRKPNVPVFVYGASYGTYWAQRFMQVAPKHADGGVILDSIVTPGQQFFSAFDLHFDLAAKKLAELCKVDVTCSAQLGPDPWAKLVAIKKKLEQGWCPESGATLENRGFLTQFLQAWQLTGYAFAAFARYDRCSAEDVAALKLLATRGNVFVPPTKRLFSQVLYMDVAFSEMWEEPSPSVDVLKKRFDDAVFGAGVYKDLFPAYDVWPKYPRDAFVDKLPEPQVPVLAMNGTLDVQTPIEFAEKTRATYTGPSRYFVEMRNANHGVLGQSPVPTGVPGQFEQCGMNLLVAFIGNQAQLDTSCAAKVAPPPFNRPQQETAFFFGTSDLWMGKAVAVPVVEPPSLEVLRRTPHIFRLGNVR